MHIARMRTHSDIVKAAGTAEYVAEMRGVSVHTARSWIARNSIPAEHWAGFAASGWATLEELAAAVAKPVSFAPPDDRDEAPTVRALATPAEN